MTPFDALAPAYGALWSETPRGRGQRASVWREIDGLFRAGDQILDLGCGTGDDALHLAGRGVQVYGIDAAEKMVETARARGVRAQRLAIEDLDRLGGPFEGALSDFGALNCVADLRPVAVQLARLLPPGGPAAICLMTRFCFSDWRHAARRWSGKTHWRGIDVYYPTARRIQAAFDPYFGLERRVRIGRGDHRLYIFRRRDSC